MALKKKEEKVIEPEFVKSLTNQDVLNYTVYNLTQKEKNICSIIAFVVGAIGAYIFYGGIGQDEFGDPTIITYICNAVIMSVAGIFAAKMFLPIRREQVLNQRYKKLKLQFVDLLDSLAASLSTGQNVPAAFETAQKDLLVQYKEDSYIVREVALILDGYKQNIPIENMILDFGKRSGIKDIENFGRVFSTVYRKGADIKDAVRATHEILSSKTQIEMEIATAIASNKNEQNIMLVMPFVIIGMIKMIGGDFASNFTTPTGLIFTTIGVALFVASYYIGKLVMNIEV